MALRRRLVAGERVAARVALLLRVLAEPLELLGRVARRRPDRRVCREEEGADHDRGHSEHGRREPALREREDEEPERESGKRRTRVRVEQCDVEQDGEQAPPHAERAADDVDERDDEHVRARERREERGDEPTDRVLLVARVEDPVLRQSREPLVIEPELLPVPPRNAGVAPRLQGDEGEVGQPDDRDDDRRQRDQPSDPASFLPGDRSEPAEHVRRNWKEVVPEGEQLSARRGPAPEHVLRNGPVDEDHRGVGCGEDVGRPERREAAHLPRHHDEGNQEQRLLPRRDDVEGRAANAEIPQLRHHDVVQDQPNDEDSDRDRGETTSANRRSPPGSARG